MMSYKWFVSKMKLRYLINSSWEQSVTLVCKEVLAYVLWFITVLYNLVLLSITEIRFKNVDVWTHHLNILLSFGAQASVFKSFPDDSKVQPGLRKLLCYDTYLSMYAGSSRKRFKITLPMDSLAHQNSITLWFRI